MQTLAKQDSVTQSSWVNSGIWTERMLAALVNGVKGDKWFSLWDKVCSIRTLRIAWKQVERNKGSAGIDRVSVERFSFKAELYLEELAEEYQQSKTE